MPNRELREGILTSERVNAVSLEAELFYRRVMSVVDDFGRFHAHPTLLKAACFPLRLDEVTEEKIGQWVRECEEAGLVMVYEQQRKRYLELLNFRNRKRALHSKFPGRESVGNEIPSRGVAGQVPVTIATRSEKRESGSESEGLLNLDTVPCPMVNKNKRARSPQLDEVFIHELKKNAAYRHCDVEREIHKARAWLMTPRERGKQLTRSFMVSWLNRIEPPLQWEVKKLPSSEDREKAKVVSARLSLLLQRVEKELTLELCHEIRDLPPRDLRFLFASLTLERRNDLQRALFSSTS